MTSPSLSIKGNERRARLEESEIVRRTIQVRVFLAPFKNLCDSGGATFVRLKSVFGFAFRDAA